MSFLEIFWLLLILIALQPVLRQRILHVGRQKAIADLEKQRQSRVIMLVHRQETMSLLGFPLLRYIDINDAEEVLHAIQITDADVPLDIVLHTPGGLVLPSLQIARAVRKHPAPVRVFVPHYAMSGGTLIALAADEIVMSEHAVLGPVDPQVGKYPAVSILNVMDSKPGREVDDETLIMADQAEKAMRQIRGSIKELLLAHTGEAEADALAHTLADGVWTHDYPITLEAAREMHLPVNAEMPKEIMELINLYRQPIRRQPSVDYTPGPRRS